MLVKRKPEDFYCKSMPTDQQMRAAWDAILYNAVGKPRLEQLGFKPEINIKRKY